MNALYHGLVRHVRHQPFRHKFAYRVFSILIDLDTLPDLDRSLRLFGHNRARLFAFFDRDHGPRDGTPLRPWIENLMARLGLEDEVGRIRILCFPRILGFVFNPLSVYFIDDRSGQTRAVVYEVKNTFGGQHAYVHWVESGANGPWRHTRAKDFHVSPFIAMNATYRFRLKPPGEDMSVLIQEQDGADAPLLTATLTGTAEPLSDRALFKAFFRYPLMTIKVIAAIHVEALRLWLKGARFHRDPGAPADEASF